MSGPLGSRADWEDTVASPSTFSSSPVTQPTLPAESQDTEEEKMPMDEVKELKEKEQEAEEEEEEEEEEVEEMTVSALLEPSTLPWAEKERRSEATKNRGAPTSEDTVAVEEEEDFLSEGKSRPESDCKNGNAKWRESMPEGERWRDEEMGAGGQVSEGEGSLADDEEEEEDELNWMPEKAALVFTPQVNIVRPSSKVSQEESAVSVGQDDEKLPLAETPAAYDPEWTEGDDNYGYLCDKVCSDKLKLGLGVAAAAVLFPLLVWGGYTLLPFDVPLLKSASARLVYTLRCSFFAVIPILLGVVVQGVARLRYGAVSPLYKVDMMENREVVVHWHYVNESLALFLFYFLLLAVMATYISQDLLKLVPLLTIIFAFGRLVYWLCLALGSSVRGLGFGLSFLPMLAMLGVNLYYICTSQGQESVFDVAPPTTPPPPAPRWWG